MTEPTAPRPTLWHGCYTDSWQEVIVPEAFAHPAKFSRGLIHRIYRHLLEQGYVRHGQTVLDPFGGVALGALDAMTYGLSWVGIELEPKFHALGQQNLALWRRQYGFTGGTLLQGDSRQARAVLAGVQAGCVVGSPPYSADGLGHSGAHQGSNDAARAPKVKNAAKFSKADLAGRDYGTTPGQLGDLPPGDLATIVGSPPYVGSVHDGNGIDQTKLTGPRPGPHTQARAEGYGQGEGQLGALPPGDLAAVVGSPPYAASINNAHNGDDPKSNRQDRTQWHGFTKQGQHSCAGYGTTPGQLGALPPGHMAAVVGSPPWEQTCEGIRTMTYKGDPARGHYKEGQRIRGGGEYGASPNQLGNTQGDTFWTAASAIVAECAALLPVGAVAVWVVKDYIKNKKRVPFCDQWRQLCERHGFVLVEEIHASLVEDHGTQAGLFGGSETLTTERKSFFRRLAEKKGSPRINHETVLILRKETPHE